jgi:hypothetical protein
MATNATTAPSAEVSTLTTGFRAPWATSSAPGIASLNRASRSSRALSRSNHGMCRRPSRIFGAALMKSRSCWTAEGITRKASPTKIRITPTTVRAMAAARLSLRVSSQRTTWSSATASMIAAALMVSASRVS